MSTNRSSIFLIVSMQGREKTILPSCCYLEDRSTKKRLVLIWIIHNYNNINQRPPNEAWTTNAETNERTNELSYTQRDLTHHINEFTQSPPNPIFRSNSIPTSLELSLQSLLLGNNMMMNKQLFVNVPRGSGWRSEGSSRMRGKNMDTTSPCCSAMTSLPTPKR